MRKAIKDDKQDMTPEESEVSSRPPLEGRELMVWTIKAMPQITPTINAILGSIMLIPLSMLLYGYFDTNENGRMSFFTFFGSAVSCLWLFFLEGCISAKKNLPLPNHRSRCRNRVLPALPQTFEKFFQRICHRTSDHRTGSNFRGPCFYLDACRSWRYGHHGLQITDNLEERNSLSPVYLGSPQLDIYR